MIETPTAVITTTTLNGGPKTNGFTHHHHDATAEPRISFSSITNDNIETLRDLNAVLFPIKYAERFYNAIVQPELADFCKLVYLDELPVGTVCCRFIEDDGEMKLYVMTMGVLADYRSQKIGSKTIRHIVSAARVHTNPKLAAVFLHVWAMNPDAKRFYERHGFVETRLHVEFYKADIECRDAWLLEYRLHPSSVSEGEGEGKDTPKELNGKLDS